METYHQKWALSCEYAATHMALRMLGVDVSEDVMRALLGSGEDPDVTFRGNIDANQDLDNYGVHARGILRLLALLKSRAYVRLEWYPQTQAFGLGFVGQELLGPEAVPDPNRRPSGAIGRYVAAGGGLGRFGYAISDEVLFLPDDPLLPGPAEDVVGQWFQTELLLWSPRTGVVPGRAGLELARRRGLI